MSKGNFKLIFKWNIKPGILLSNCSPPKRVGQADPRDARVLLGAPAADGDARDPDVPGHRRHPQQRGHGRHPAGRARHGVCPDFIIFNNFVFFNNFFNDIFI